MTGFWNFLGLLGDWVLWLAAVVFLALLGVLTVQSWASMLLRGKKKRPFAGMLPELPPGKPRGSEAAPDLVAQTKADKAARREKAAERVMRGWRRR